MKKAIKQKLRQYLNDLFYYSIKSAARSQSLSKLAERLKEIEPDISNQYSNFKIDTPYLNLKSRVQHAFQISLVLKIIDKISNPVILDIGDSAGTHLNYIKSLCNKGSSDPNNSLKCLSVNVDPKAIERIKKKGIDVIQSRAEEIENYNIKPDITLLYETLEHISDPISFLHDMALKLPTNYLVITVPYLSRSQVGLRHIRGDNQVHVNAENTHLFELCPEDWKLLFQHSGWKVYYEKIYRQYPVVHPLYLTKPLWRKFDFEGFYGVILQKNDKWSQLYDDWN